MGHQLKSCGKRHAGCQICRDSWGTVCAPGCSCKRHLGIPGRANKGRKIIGRRMSSFTAEHRRHLSEAQRCAWAEGRRTAPGGSVTGIHQRLAAFLKWCGIADLQWEVPFGRYRVDLYSPSLHLAFEADGAAWHENHPFRDQLTRDRWRDAALLEQFDLPVTRFGEAEIQELPI